MRELTKALVLMGICLGALALIYFKLNGEITVDIPELPDGWEATEWR